MGRVESTAGYPQDALPVGTVLGQYTIVSVLGRGAFGITYLAKEAHLDQLVAIKEYLPQGYATRGDDSTVHSLPGDKAEIFHYGRDRFLHEAKTLRRFKHPNIVRVLTYFEKYNTAYFVMEYEVGCDLKSYLENHPQPTERELIDLFGPIIFGLAEIHRHGYIHRDIKPQNIYIREDGSPVLLDFGTARDVVNVRSEQLTRILTEGYAPYEQDNPEWAKQGPWTDIFALGSTLYYTITGKLPIDSQRRSYACLTNKPDPYIPLVSSELKGYSRKFLEAVDNALAFSPDQRPKSVDVWWKALLTEKAGTATVVIGSHPKQPASNDIENSDDKSGSLLFSKSPRTRPVRWSWVVSILAVMVGAGLLGYILIDERSDKSNSSTATSGKVFGVAPKKTESDSHRLQGAPLELAGSAFILAKTSAWHFSRADRIEELIKQISDLPATSDRTRFLVDQEVKLDEARRGAESNLTRYVDALAQLKAYGPQAESAIQAFLKKPEYANDLTYQSLGRVIREHLTSESQQKMQLQRDLVVASEGED